MAFRIAHLAWIAAIAVLLAWIDTRALIGVCANADCAAGAALVVHRIRIRAELLRGAAIIVAVRATGADRFATAIDRAAIVPKRTTTRTVVHLANLVARWIRVAADPKSIRRTALFLPITGAQAAGIVTAFGMLGIARVGIAGCTGTTIGSARIRRIRRANALTSVGNLPARTGHRLGRRGRTPRGICPGFQQHPARQRRASQSEQALEHTAAALAARQRPG